MRDKLKNLLLVLLLVLMGVLLAVTFFVSVQGKTDENRQPEGTAGLPGGTLLPGAATARPEVAAILGENGVYAARNAEQYALLYQKAEPLFQEAIGSAGAPEQIGEQDYLNSLHAPALLFHFHAPQPLYLLQAWSGSAALRGDLPVRSAALVRTEQGAAMLLTDDSGKRWRAGTAASVDELTALCNAAGMGNAVLASDSRLPGDEVLTTGVTTASAWTASEPELVRKGELSQTVQSLFDMNAYLTRVYSDPDGSLVYVESHSTIRLSPKGDLVYSGGAGTDLELNEKTGFARQAEICRKAMELLRRLWEQAGASGELSLEEIRCDPERDRVFLRFGLHFDGLFLEKRTGDWATVTVENGAVTGVTAALRQLNREDRCSLLPLSHAAALLDEKTDRLRIRLLEEQDGRLTPQICRVTEG